MKKYLLNFILIFFAAILTSCGGGGGGSGSSGNSNVGPSNDNTTATVVLDSSAGGVADGAAKVTLTPMVVLKFSAQMNPTTVNSTNVFISTSTSIKDAVSLSPIAANASYTSFSFSPRIPLASNTTYYIIVTGTKTTSNVNVSGQFSFTTSDQIKPFVTIKDPANGESGVTTNPSIVLQFSETVENVESSITLYKGQAGGTTVPLNPILLAAGNRYSFSPLSALAPNTKYYIVVSSNVKDLAGNAIDQTTFSFTTGTSGKPTVVKITPVDNTTGVAIYGPVFVFRFSESVSPVTYKDISLYDLETGESMPSNWGLGESGNLYTVQVLRNLKPFHNYALVFESSITDLDGNALDTTWFTFTTGDVITLLSDAGNEYVSNNQYMVFSNNVGESMTIQSIAFNNSAVTVGLQHNICTGRTVDNHDKCTFQVGITSTLSQPTAVQATVTYTTPTKPNGVKREFTINASYQPYR